jgi:chemotaxis protein histidine kinase CheA
MIGGRISFESEYGHGSKFTVSLPLTQNIMAIGKAQAGR